MSTGFGLPGTASTISPAASSRRSAGIPIARRLVGAPSVDRQVVDGGRHVGIAERRADPRHRLGLAGATKASAWGRITACISACGRS